MNRFNNVIFGQKAFVLNEQKEILILKRAKGEVYEQNWDVPGGKVEEGDTLLRGLTREIEEECGLELKRVILLLSSSRFNGNAKDSPIVIRNIYLALADGEVEISDEHSEFKWIKPQELSNYNFPPDADYQAVILKIPEIIANLDLNKKYSLIF